MTHLRPTGYDAARPLTDNRVASVGNTFISDPDPPSLRFGAASPPDADHYRIHPPAPDGYGAARRIDVLYWITIALATFMLVWISNGHDVLP